MKYVTIDYTKDTRLKIIFKVQTDFYTILSEIKTLDGAQFNKAQKCWFCAITKNNLNKLNEIGFSYSEDLDNYIKKTESSNFSINLSNFKRRLYSFQLDGVKFIEKTNGKCLLADEMGLGKSGVSLAWVVHSKQYPALVICPASLKINWEREIDMCCSLSYHQITSNIINPNKNIYILNYDMVEKRKEILLKMPFKTLILDECHYIKDPKRQRTKAIINISNNIPHIIGISGTPIINKPIEFFNILNMINSTLFPSWWTYTGEFCDRKQTKYGLDVSGSSNLDKLYDLLKENIMVRRLKKEVLPELPDKTISIIPIEIDNRTEYDQSKNDFINWLLNKEHKDLSNNPAMAMVKIEKLKQIITQGKINTIKDWIDNFINSGEKLIVFCTHTDTIDSLFNYFKKISVKLDGRDSITDKQKAIDNFQNNDKIKIFIANIKAGGVGITLTASSNVAFVELGWTPGEHDQAGDRCHRIGQKNAVTEWYLIGQDTIEEDILKLLDQKRTIITQVIDGEINQDYPLLSELLNNIRSK